MFSHYQIFLLLLLLAIPLTYLSLLVWPLKVLRSAKPSALQPDECSVCRLDRSYCESMHHITDQALLILASLTHQQAGRLAITRWATSHSHSQLGTIMSIFSSKLSSTDESSSATAP